MRRIGLLMNTTPERAGIAGPHRRTRAGPAGGGLVDWPQSADRLPDGRSGDLARLRKNADELAALGPDVLVAGVGPTTLVLQQATRSIPIVMAQGVDPVGAGFVKSMARPGGNVTGFTQFEYALAAKWVEMLREIAPHVNRIGVVRDMSKAGQRRRCAVRRLSRAAASPLGLELYPVDLRIRAATPSVLSRNLRASLTAA